MNKEETNPVSYKNKCGYCKVVKPASLFYKSNIYRCKACFKKAYKKKMTQVHKPENILCKICKKVKPNSAFYKSNLYKCKECISFHNKKKGEEKRKERCVLRKRKRDESEETDFESNIPKKKCVKCLKVKYLTKFSKITQNTAKGLKTYYRSDCKSCASLKTKRWQELNPEYNKKKSLSWYYKKKAGILKKKPRQTWEERLKKHNEYKRNRYRSDKEYREKEKMRADMSMFIRGTACFSKKKRKEMEDLLGMSREEIRKYIESQFREGMTWNNIEIDHIMPLSHFDFFNMKEKRMCFHYTNVQPLFPYENQQKRNKIVRDMVWVNNRWVDKYSVQQCID
jgi:hypothetical protein